MTAISLPNVQPAEPLDHREDGRLDVVDVFPTIQGEGPFAGRPAIFVRLAGCNLDCPLCFGVGVKSRIPRLSRSIGPSVRLDKVEAGETVLTFNEDFALVETQVTRVLRREVSEWLELRISGRTYDVTPEHPFFTTRGLVGAEDLRLGDDVLEARPQEIIAFKKLGNRNPMKRAEVAAASAASRDYVGIARKVSRTRRAKFASGELLPSFSCLSPEDQEECRRRQSEAKRREKNPNWTGSNANLLDVQEAINRGEYVACQRCGAAGVRLLTHHADGNHDNDARDNILVWCHRCHNQHHQRGYNFWNGRRRDGKQLVKKHNGQRVEKITRCRGSLPVVNLVCYPYNTYLANGMWVHNCDTDYTSQRQRLNPLELMLRISAGDKERQWGPGKGRSFGNFHRGLIVLTGGEPFRQNFVPFVRTALANYDVQVETNGSLDPRFDEHTGWELHVICSPKTPKLHPRILPWIGAYKYVVAAGEINPIDGLPVQTLGRGCSVARPHDGFRGEVYVQPQDDQDPEKNRLNTLAAVQACMKFGYRLSVQMHKVVGLP